MVYRLSIFLVLFGLSISTFAQKPKVKNDPTHDDQPIHFGFALGLNFMDYRFEHSDYAKDSGIYIGMKGLNPGFNIHAIANIRLSDRWDIRLLPGISFGDRFIYAQKDRTNLLNEVEMTNDGSSYIELPLSFKYKSVRLNNFRPYLIGGGNVTYDWAAKDKYDEKLQLFIVSPFDIYAELGLGIDFYMVYFKFGMELKYSIGMKNIILRTDSNGEIPDEYRTYTDSINKLYSHMVILLFNFE